MYFLTADVGYGVLEPLQKKMGDRFINVGIAEQSMISIASGLALAGKEVYTFTMCAFYLKCIEAIKLDLCYQDVPVTMIGVGVGVEYEYLGTTHFALADDKIMEQLLNIDVMTAYDKDQLKEILKHKAKRPRYIRISRFDEVRESSDITFREYPECGGNLNYFKEKYAHSKQKE